MRHLLRKQVSETMGFYYVYCVDSESLMGTGSLVEHDELAGMKHLSSFKVACDALRENVSSQYMNKKKRWLVNGMIETDVQVLAIGLFHTSSILDFYVMY